MKTVELFCGTKSFSKVAEKFGFETWTTDYKEEFNSHHVGDVLDSNTQKIIMEKVKEAKIVWMSPVCTTWSLASGNTYWDEFRMPKRKESIEAMKMMMFCRCVADYCVKHNKIFFIENPNGRAVWILDNKYLKRCWYCQYGDIRAKPTNIWTNMDIEFNTCFNGNKDCHHESAPRGSKTGTQGLKGNKERSIIPPRLFHKIFNQLGFKEEEDKMCEPLEEGICECEGYKITCLCGICQKCHKKIKEEGDK